ncbi:hypothetical protein ACFPER_04805 [Agromyces aurantiacus]|uniref:Uncharacterized protein n=1 Tax=Agromyces aurantiacus TaxID=165814 RepID=A0ABV9R2P8_9MICO|nr:hypothetical protein [Agromyces aurantiacus]MBM7502778.1 hypothetical protein [Agromyces aurantiacus]
MNIPNAAPSRISTRAASGFIERGQQVARRRLQPTVGLEDPRLERGMVLGEGGEVAQTPQALGRHQLSDQALHDVDERQLGAD